MEGEDRGIATDAQRAEMQEARLRFLRTGSYEEPEHDEDGMDHP